MSRDGVSALPSGGLPVLVPGGSRRGSCPLWHRRAGVGVGTGSFAGWILQGWHRGSVLLPLLPAPHPAPRASRVRATRVRARGSAPALGECGQAGGPRCPGTALAGGSCRGCQSPAGPAPHPGASVNAISADRLRAGTPGSQTRHCARPGPARCLPRAHLHRPAWRGLPCPQEPQSMPCICDPAGQHPPAPSSRRAAEPRVIAPSPGAVMGLWLSLVSW